MSFTTSSQTGFPQTTLNCRGIPLDLNTPRIMGILNLTPDSFSDGGSYNRPDAALRQVEQMLAEGADIIDIGGYSSRPGAEDISVEEEWSRVGDITAALIEEFPDAIFSADTFRAEIARRMLDLGVHMVNDISGGMLDEEMIPLVARYPGVPYIAMHMPGTPRSMQDDPAYDDVLAELGTWMVARINAARNQGIHDIIIDPGFGFGKTQLHNFQLIMGIERLVLLDVPVLAGISRKSFLYRFFEEQPGDTVDVATALHLELLRRGVRMLRVHDVRPAAKVRQLFGYLQANGLI